MDIHITLLSAALAALINLWLAMRCGKVRTEEKIMHGDGGNSILAKRMRAHSNFVEYTPIALLLVLALELTGHGGWALALTALAFLIGRILHAIGMDADIAGKPRMAGMMLTFIPMVGLAIAAMLAAFKLI